MSDKKAPAANPKAGDSKSSSGGQQILAEVQAVRAEVDVLKSLIEGLTTRMIDIGQVVTTVETKVDAKLVTAASAKSRGAASKKKEDAPAKAAPLAINLWFKKLWLEGAADKYCNPANVKAAMDAIKDDPKNAKKKEEAINQLAATFYYTKHLAKASAASYDAKGKELLVKDHNAYKLELESGSKNKNGSEADDEDDASAGED